jgi:predicted GNAT family acetyltransferase
VTEDRDTSSSNTDGTDAPVEVHDDPGNSRWVATVGDAQAGIAMYRRSGNVVTFTHTVVEPAFEGHGVGSTLARTALDAARERGDRVVPRCEFIAGYIDSHAEYGDLVDS